MKASPSALITGASRGIGRGIAFHLAANGWNLTLSARDAERLDGVKRQLEQLGGRVEAVPADMADDLKLREVAGVHESVHGSMNALVLAAGVGSAAPVADYPMRRFDKQFAVNIRAPFYLISTVLPLLRAGAKAEPGRGGRIVALTSLEGVYSEAGLAAYGASKAALISLMRSINIEEGRNGVTASAISPAFVDTDMSTWVEGRIPAEAMIPVDDVVKVVELMLGISANAVLPHVVMNRAGVSPYCA